MRSAATSRFWRLFNALPADVKGQARGAFALFRKDPFAPPLEFKEIKGQKGLWSARIDGGYRVLGLRKGDRIQWTWIGLHDEYLRQLRHRP